MKRVVLTLLTAMVTVFVVAGPAAAASELGLSNDGVTFSSSLPDPLFDSAIRWVPGDSRTATFYVRNQSTDVGSLAVDVLGGHLGTLMDSGDIRITVTGGGGVTTPASDGIEHRVLTASGISGGATFPIAVTVDFSESSTNETQLISTDLKFRVTLTQSSPVNPGGTGTDGTGTGSGSGSGNDSHNGSGNGSGLLPDTGAPYTTWIVALGSILLGTGIAVTSRRRNNPTGESDV